MTEEQQAERVLAGTRYLVLSTADADGNPWATPVWYARDGQRFFWVSRPSARHSANLEVRTEAALVVFDSQVPVGGASAYYAKVTAGQVAPDDLADGIAIFSRESEAQELGAWGLDRVTGEAPFRLYCARVTESWVLAEDGGPDRRLPLATP
ncbi:pyridoxamine 5'-phosphate oxidase family protein [Microlunatus parietis]|uniref:Pyridoxamine 5'-phosphate oxidase N-terminal domain-containing protein n=1 Tax=Microlunatus parietis TaxID=682979 RepID=A0A7Y9I782_9ACTN|nr:pyridoxamine 5'-phosphate oxidase family protein [Microlunatus parietis]NYE71583.1 hypothetical protein [Microlunatus parietis]